MQELETNNHLNTLQKKLETNNRLDALLALRGLACLMVVIIHCTPPRDSITYRGYDLSWLTYSDGLVAVWIFFVLSGYLMGKAFYTERYTGNLPGAINFWRNRVLRICPLYYFAVLILSIFVYPDILKLTNWGYLIRVCTFTYQPIINSQHIGFDDALWSLSTELQFYVFVPFIYNFFRARLFSQKHVVRTAILIIGITLFFRSISCLVFRSQIIMQTEYAFKYWYTPLINNVDLFLSGFLLNVFLKYQNPEQSINYHRQKSLIRKYLAGILLIILYLVTAHHLYHQELWNLPNRPGGWRTLTTILIFPPLTAIITSFFIFAFDSDVYNDFRRNEKLSFASMLKNPLRILEVFGNISYGVYIWHMPIIGKIFPIFTSSIPIEAFYARLTATLILSILLASVTYYLVELPAAKWKVYWQSHN